MNWGRVLGFTYAILVTFGALVTVAWGLFYGRSHDFNTTASTAVSGFATYAVGLVALFVVSRELDGGFRWLFNLTRAWKLPGSQDLQVVVAGVVGICAGYALWQ